ncbi:MAG: hypothetical protein HYX63_01955 [Gammaproteobacteria bacterium]|nr:hypothetical protein [Gammaproteobacteria bacterium]
MTRTQRRLGAWALLLWSTASCAAGWYQVEVIVFRYRNAAEESWAKAADVPDFSRAQHLAPRVESTPSDTAILAYTALDPGALHLTGAYDALAHSATHQPLAHLAWRQAADDSRAVFIGEQTDTAKAEDATSENWVEGQVRLRVSAKDQRVETLFVAHQGATPVRVAQTRNVALGELNYFDHPLLGVLVQVDALNRERVVSTDPTPKAKSQ